ncbi:MAG TPA: T9SS type A sorting domain-containing protein [Melioribacteraceae bacterium]|nr:T9SS type A sorting domain-containing protein [Melioribacteraceae bacterium]
MKIKYLSLYILTLVFTTIGYPQSHISSYALWGNDRMILDKDPLGSFSGVQNSDGKIYVAIKNLVMFPSGGIIIMFSDDLGVNWKATQSDAWMTIDGTYGDFKLLNGPNNSIYLFALIDNMITCKRIDEPGGIWASQMLAREFDAVYSEELNNFFFLYTDPFDNELKFLQSEIINGEFSTKHFGYLDYNTHSPRIVISGRKVGIAYMYNYYLPKEASPIAYSVGEFNMNGILVPFSPVNAVAENIIKTEYKCALNGEKVWVVYTESVNNKLLVKGTFSTNGGSSFSIPIDIATLPASNNYWPNIKKNKDGFDLVYYYDEPQSGEATNSTDKIVYNFNATGNSSQFIYNASLSSHPPYWTSSNPKPEIVPLQFSTSYDLGVIWLGWDQNGGKLFFNRFNSVTGIKTGNELPIDFELFNNYPNPFNPSTTIRYSIPQAGFVSLKIYDLQGKEVATLVNEFKQPGNYDSQFSLQNSRLTSGIYFYKITAGKYSETKKMIILK